MARSDIGGSADGGGGQDSDPGSGPIKALLASAGGAAHPSSSRSWGCLPSATTGGNHSPAARLRHQDFHLGMENIRIEVTGVGWGRITQAMLQNTEKHFSAVGTYLLMSEIPARFFYLKHKKVKEQHLHNHIVCFARADAEVKQVS